ncbi:MAG: FUSC family protein [Acidimicrobiales bacterium]
MSSERRALPSSLRVDLRLLTPVAGAITALPVVAVFVFGLSIGNTRAAISLAVGANLVAIVSLVGAPRLSIGLAVSDALVMGLSVFVGSATGPYPWLHSIVLIPWCFAAGMLVAFGKTQGAIGTQAIIGFVVLGRFSGTPIDALGLGALVTVGALVEVVALFVLRLPPSLRYQRGRLADGFEALAELARRDPNSSTHDVASSLDDAEGALSAPSLFGRTDVRDLRALLDQSRRMRFELMTLNGLRVRISNDDTPDAPAAIAASLLRAGAALDEISAGLRRPTQSTKWQEEAAAFGDDLARLEGQLQGESSGSGSIAHQCLPYLAALGGQLRAAGNLMEKVRAGGGRRAWRPHLAKRQGSDPRDFQGDFEVVRANLRRDSPELRHSVRLAIAVPASLFLASWLSLPRGYWLAFAVAVILKPDYSTLFDKGLGRVVGTLVGATLAAVLMSELHPDLFLTTVLVALMAWAVYSTWAASFSVSMGFVTALILILLSTSLHDTVGTALDRLLDVTLGAVIAFVAYLVWPTSPKGGVEETQSALFSSLRVYLATVLGLVASKPVDAATLETTSKSARLAWANSEAAVDRSIQEPAATRLDPSQSRGQLAAAQRIVRATQALWIDAERGAMVDDFLELDELSHGLLAGLDDLARAFSGDPIAPVPGLRKLYRQVEQPLRDRDAAPSIALHLDELVNAIDTAAHLAGLELPVAS